MYCMNKIHENLPGATFNKPDTIVTMPVCMSGYYPNESCREQSKVYTDYFVSGSYLCPSDDKPCPIHATPTPTPTPLPPQNPQGGQDPNQGGGPGQGGPGPG